jgi:hypothetical protein
VHGASVADGKKALTEIPVDKSVLLAGGAGKWLAALRLGLTRSVAKATAPARGRRRKV